MIFPIIYPSAASFWRNYFYIKKLESNPSVTARRRTLPDGFVLPNNDSLIQILKNEFQIMDPISIMASEANKRIRYRPDLICSVMPKELPKDGFIELCRLSLGEEKCFIVVASPELCFLQAAASLPILDLIKYGYELCAIFFFDQTRKFGFAYHDPVTDLEKMKRYIGQASGMKGVQQARKAIRYINEQAGSPMEILLSMFVSLPISLGGFAIHGFSINGQVDLNEEGCKIIGRDHCKCDLVWREIKVVLEYDSNQVHMESSQHAMDKRRVTALNASGYKVFVITTADMHHLVTLENILFSVRKSLKMKKEMLQFQKFQNKREELYAWIKEQMRVSVSTDLFP